MLLNVELKDLKDVYLNSQGYDNFEKIRSL